MESGLFSKGEYGTYSWENGIPAWMLRDMAKQYCDIWKEPPWNENFWKPQNVIRQVFQELSKQDGRLFLSVYKRGLYHCEYENNHCVSQIPRMPSDKERMSVAGFTWGYAVAKNNLRKISGGKLLDGIFSKDSYAYYIDELGVAMRFRRSGVGKKLSEVLLKEAERLGYKKVVLRTDKKAEAAISLYKRLGFKDLSVRDEKYPERTYWIKEL